MVIDESKLKRQKEALSKWRSSGYKGTIIAATGFGKSFMAIMAISKLRSDGLVGPVIVTVPYRELKKQWEARLRKHKQLNDTRVIVNNSAAKYHAELFADLVIHDEVHTVPAEVIGDCLKIQRKYTLCLTATIKRKDGAEIEVLRGYPIVDNISIEECLENGWVSPFKVYNIGVPLSEEDKLAYEKADRSFKHYAAQLSGFGGAESFKTAKLWVKSSDPSKRSIASAYYKCIRNRKSICVNNPNKLEVIRNIVSMFPEKYGLIFGESIRFANEITEALEGKCLTFHSKMTAKQKREAMEMYKDKTNDVRLISSVKALDAGFDFPDVSLGVIAAGNSSLINSKQRLGRIIRAVDGKKATIINLFTPDTQEVRWLEGRLKETESVWLRSFEVFKQEYKRDEAA